MTEDDYEILSLESTAAPEQLTGTDWYCYVIQQGTNTIRGYQQGTLENVTQAVEEIVGRLNERRLGKRGRVHLYTTSRSKKGAGK